MKIFAVRKFSMNLVTVKRFAHAKGLLITWLPGKASLGRGAFRDLNREVFRLREKDPGTQVDVSDARTPSFHDNRQACEKTVRGGLPDTGKLPQLKPDHFATP